MEGSSSSILYRQSWNNLVDLPSNLASLLYNANVSPQEVIIELVLRANNKLYAGWSGMISSGSKSVGIDPIFAQSLCLSDKQFVTVNVKIRNFKSNRIFLEPEQFSDWELVELHANHIESKLIEQSRCVALHQVLVVYPTKTSSIKLQVKDIGTSTETYALIDPFAEVSIAPKLRERKKKSQSVKSNKSSKLVHEDVCQGPTLLKRGFSIPCLSTSNDNLSYEITVNTAEFSRMINRSNVVSVSVIPGPNYKYNRAPSEQPSADSEVSENSSLLALVETKAVCAKLTCSDIAPPDTVGLSFALAVALNVENKVGYKVIIRQAHNSIIRKVGTLIIHPYVTQSKKSEALSLNSLVAKEHKAVLSRAIMEYFFKKNLLNKSPITNFCKIPIIPGILPNGAMMTIKRNDDPRAWIKALPVEDGKISVKIELGENLLRSASFIQETAFVSEEEPIYGLRSKLDGVSDFISTSRNSGVMVHGSSGSGKTLFLKHVSKEMREHGIFTKYVPCETKMNEGLDQLCLNFNQWVNEALWHEPSLLILDNLDKILPAETENTDSTISNQLTECLMSLFEKIGSQKNTNVCLMVSGLSKDSFNKQLSMSHVIENYLHLTAPDKATRAIILDEYLLKFLGCDLKFDIMDIVLETEGFLPKDLKVLSDRILYESLHSQDSINRLNPQGMRPIKKSLFEKALANYQPTNLRGVKLEKSGTSWADIGGLTEAKRVLLETLEWPTKYAPIFSNCPLRLRSGILLYGYPGCGKTLLANAIAGQCGLNFISIKGPEILNKYIGASEQSVRELFDRALSAKPCILFFDEFDSIAPKRGHDSTGVTDRVVNQMLTQMDGAEGLDGVYVLAATSRPDLIDSALLRPGRLDKSIICDMPNSADRLAILKCIFGKMDLAKDVDLEKIATKTEGFSGADMQGLGYNAFLKAVHEKLNQEPEKVSDAKDSNNFPTYDFFQINAAETVKNDSKLRPAEKLALLQKLEKVFGDEEGTSKRKQNSFSDNLKVLIRQCHIEESLADTKPSISATERKKLDDVYAEFSTGRDGNMPDGSASNNVGGRMTLM